MKHVWSVFCRHMVEDKRTGNPSLIDVTDRIEFRGSLPEERPINLPIPFPFYIVSKWWRDPHLDLEDYAARVRWLSPDGDELRRFDYQLAFGELERLHTIGELRELHYSKNGTYHLEIEYLDDDDWITVAVIPLDVIHEVPESEENASEPTE